MIKVFVGVGVIMLCFAGYSFWKLKRSQEELNPKRASETELTQAEQGRDAHRFGPRRKAIDVQLQPTVTVIPELASSSERFEKGDLVRAGQVADVEKGVVLVKDGGEDQFLVTSRAVPSYETATAVGRVWLEDGTLETVMLRGGATLRVGRTVSQGVAVQRAVSEGTVVQLLADRAVIRRRDGGTHYIVFGEKQLPPSIDIPAVASVPAVDIKPGAPSLP